MLLAGVEGLTVKAIWDVGIVVFAFGATVAIVLLSGRRR